jgi:hypothetical protein
MDEFIAADQMAGLERVVVALEAADGAAFPIAVAAVCADFDPQPAGRRRSSIASISK